ncbi:ATP-binding protein [Pelagicoccus sp. SDUM812005]|uniref:ATP-binding protein n=1 Tax=Pelagicoccus sp. SDUM812005 TaxID=3041257 RepID=UPI00280EE404|nr:ATP-binding protein [Pelagicoccus sp. SDUM812005]MDQ8181973.1 ATP-binding protein [Pelagicoccus sp. SDUM812005]
MPKVSLTHQDGLPEGDLYSPPPEVELEAVLRTELLEQRLARSPDYQTEAETLQLLAKYLAESPRDILQKLSEVILGALRVESAGVSLLSEESGDFYWPAIAGEWEPHVGGGTPRNFGPCGVVLDRNGGQLFQRPERYYPYLEPVSPGIHEVLLSPFYLNGEAVGTVWAVSHDPQRCFDSEDLRLLTSIGSFASAGFASLEAVLELERERERSQERERALQGSVDELEAARLAALNLMEDAVEGRTLVENLNQQLSATSARDSFRVALADALRPLANPTDIQAKAAEILGRQLGVSRALYVDVGADEEHITVHRDYADGVPTSSGHFLLSDFGSFVETESRAGRTIAASDVEADERLSDAEQEAYAQLQIAAFVSVPLVKAGRLVGLFGVHSAQPRIWAPEEIFLIEDTAERTWAVVERAKVEHELRESEARFRILADNMAQLAWTCDEFGTVNWYNQRWFDYTGCGMEEMQGWGWTKVHHPEHLERVKESVDRARLSGEIWEETFPLRRADGEFRWFLSRAVPIRNEAGEIVRWFGTNTDITEQRAAEDALREADRRKDEFLATLAHELRNPLAPIRMGLEVMKVAMDDPDTMAEVRTTMERQTLQLITLVDDLLDVSRITRGKLHLRKCRVDLAEVIRSSIEASKPYIDEEGHELTVCLPEKPIALEADPNRLAQVVSNLLNNAAKYTPEGGRIWLSCEAQGDVAVVSVRDNGIGIPEDMLERIFEMFAQIDRPMEKGYTGLGIGLTLVKSLVEMHEGEISVRSEGLNQGTEFSIRLPILRAEPEGGKQSPEGPKPSAKGGKARVLIVDDNRDAATMLSSMIKMFGYDIRIAHDGMEAIEMAGEFQPKAILMDLGMPKMSGYEAAERIRQQSWGKSITLIALTGWGQDEDKRKTKSAGFDHHLVKPADPVEVQALLAKSKETTA